MICSKIFFLTKQELHSLKFERCIKESCCLNNGINKSENISLELNEVISHDLQLKESLCTRFCQSLIVIFQRRGILNLVAFILKVIITNESYVGVGTYHTLAERFLKIFHIFTLML